MAFFKFFFRLLKIVIVIGCILASILAGAIFASENPERIAPVIFGYTLPHLWMGLYLVVSMAIGLIVGVLVTLWGSQRRIYTARKERNRSQKQLKILENADK